MGIDLGVRWYRTKMGSKGLLFLDQIFLQPAADYLEKCVELHPLARTSAGVSAAGGHRRKKKQLLIVPRAELDRRALPL